MKIFITLIIIATNIYISFAFANECNGKYSNGSRPSEAELLEISDANKEWYLEFKKISKHIVTPDMTIRLASKEYPEIKRALEDVRHANLCGADLSEMNFDNINLAYGNLRNANLYKANFKGANLEYTDLSGAFLKQATLKGAIGMGTKFEGAYMQSVDFSGQYIALSNFNNAFLYGVNFSNATFVSVSLKNAVLSEADMKNTVYEPSYGSEPIIIPPPRNIEYIKFENSSHGLVYMREQYKKLGLKEEERKLTYAINSHIPIVYEYGTGASLEVPNYEYWVKYIAFNLTTKWGMEPGRSLRMLFYLILLFSVPYYFSLIINGKDGLWIVWGENRARKDLGAEEPEKVVIGKIKSIYIAIYFSFLSAFHFGWRDINVSGWIARIQPQEYSYTATGWVRVLSGVQSLISVYLLVIWILTYFGNPFS